MDSKALTSRIVKKYETRDPFRIAEKLGIILVYAPLGSLRGLRQYCQRRTLIYINSDLDEHQQRLVCAHELGHHFMHRGLNRVFMDHETYMVPGRYEKEAHQFSVDLLYNDYELQCFLDRPLQDAANYMGVSLRLAEYRMKSVQPSLFNLDLAT